MAKTKNAGKKSGAKKIVAKKKASKKAAAKTKPKTAAAAALAAQPCLTLTQAAFIVGGCLPSGSHGPSDTLEEVGLITENLRLIFRECVFNGLDAGGCEIARSEIPNDADTEIGEVIQAVTENAH
jgi:hypothetical protein